MKRKKNEQNIFATPFNAEPADVSDNLRHEIIKLQSNNKLKATVGTTTSLCLSSINCVYVLKIFPVLRRHAVRFASLFGATYGSENFFSN